MKRRELLCVGAALLLAVSCGKKNADEKKLTVAANAIVNFVVGDAVIVNAGAESKATPGALVGQGMQVLTRGTKSVIDLYIGENAVRVLGDSSVTFETMLSVAGGGENVSIVVEKGRAFNRIARKLGKDDSYSVRTKTAVAAVRGTEFFVSDDNGKTKVQCLDGKVAVATDAGKPEVVLEKNEQADIAPGEDIVKKQIETDEINRLKILSDVKVMQDDIRKQYEQQRDEILRKFEEQKAEIKKYVDDQKAADAQRVEDQRATDKANVEAVKGDTKAAIDATNTQTKDAAQASQDAAKKGIADAKSVDTSGSSASDAVKRMREEQKKNVDASK